jgi:Na+/H+ antiporter NhaA
MPGLFVLVPAIAATGGSGFFMSKSRQGQLVETKKKRMPFIAANGLLVLIPCAIFLNRWAAAGAFDNTFYVVQAFELLAGAVNLTLMGLNIRDGLKMSGRFGQWIANDR